MGAPTGDREKTRQQRTQTTINRITGVDVFLYAANVMSRRGRHIFFYMW